MRQNKGLTVMTPSGKKKALDQIRERIFDTVEYANGASMNGQKSFFTNIQNKNKTQTNLSQGSFLEKDQSFKVISLKLLADTGIADLGVLPQLIRRSALNFKISDRSFWEGSARFAAGGIDGIVEYSGGGLATDYAYQQLGQSHQHGVFFGKEFYHAIPSQYSFSVVMDTVGTALTPAVDLEVQCVLDGLRRRPML
jgi:hypothetical protein